MSGILVVRPSSLGDVVWALASAHDVAAARPGLAVDWLAEEAVHQRLWRESLAKLWHPHLYWLAADEE
mgnify:CR=1 FL=1